MSVMTPENVNLAQFIDKIFGGECAISEHVDENGQPVIASVASQPTGETQSRSYATVGLSDHKLGQDKSGIALGCELVMKLANAQDIAADTALAAVARTIKQQKMLTKPGIIFANALDGLVDGSQMKHLLFAVPSMWEDSLYPLQFKAKTVLWLQALPISEAELTHARENGPDALGKLLEPARNELTSLMRDSVC